MLDEQECGFCTIPDEFWPGPSILSDDGPHPFCICSIDSFHTLNDGFIRAIDTSFDKLVSDCLVLFYAFKQLLSESWIINWVCIGGLCLDVNVQQQAKAKSYDIAGVLHTVQFSADCLVCAAFRSKDSQSCADWTVYATSLSRHYHITDCGSASAPEQQ